MDTVKTLQTIIRKMLNEKETRNLGTLLRMSAELAPEEYRKVSYDRRVEIQGVALDSVVEAIKNDATEELNEGAKDSLGDFPRIEQKTVDLDEQSEESKVIQAFEDVEMEGGYVKYDDPWDPLSTLLKMSFSDRILLSYLKLRFGLRDRHDYDQMEKWFFGPLRRVLGESLGERFKDRLYLLLFQVSRIMYGVPPIKRLRPTDVYLGGFQFYRGHEGESTITFSTSSGLPNPLERFGTDEFARRYSIPDHELGGFLLKNPYRMDNFAKGILNREVDCKRVYVWEKGGTSESLKRALAVVPTDKRQEFLDEAVKLLAEAFVFDRIRIIELDEFDRWMRRFTRNARGEIMFSLRGKESKKISEAIQINFDIENLRRRSREIAKMLNVVQVALHKDPRAGIAVFMLIFGEDMLHSLLESTLRMPLEFEDEVIGIGRVIKDYGALEQSQAQDAAEKVIGNLLD